MRQSQLRPTIALVDIRMVTTGCLSCLMLVVQIPHRGARPPAALRRCMRSFILSSARRHSVRAMRRWPGSGRGASRWGLAPQSVVQSNAHEASAQKTAQASRHLASVASPPSAPSDVPTSPARRLPSRPLCPPRRCIVVGFWPANGRAAPRRRRTVTSQSPCRRRAANPSSPLVHLRPLRNRRCGTARGPCMRMRHTGATLRGRHAAPPPLQPLPLLPSP